MSKALELRSLGEEDAKIAITETLAARSVAAVLVVWRKQQVFGSCFCWFIELLIDS